jgi:hypothetical protein
MGSLEEWLEDMMPAPTLFVVGSSQPHFGAEESYTAPMTLWELKQKYPSQYSNALAKLEELYSDRLHALRVLRTEARKGETVL